SHPFESLALPARHCGLTYNIFALSKSSCVVHDEAQNRHSVHHYCHWSWHCRSGSSLVFVERVLDLLLGCSNRTRGRYSILSTSPSPSAATPTIREEFFWTEILTITDPSDLFGVSVKRMACF